MFFDYKRNNTKHSAQLFPHRLPGVFFAACMALLMLSLAKSILAIKLLHHGETEVRQMSVSAQLLDRYGSMGQSLAESIFTSSSTRTLDDLTQGQGSE